MRTYPHARRRGAIAAAALAVVASTLSACQSSDAEPATPEPTVLGEQVVSLDGGTLTDDEALEACSSPRFANDAPVEVLYGVRQAAQDGDVPVVLLRNAEGELRMCDLAGPDSPSQLPLPTADADTPVAFLASRASWDCTGKRLASYTSQDWFAVADGVDRVERRFVVDGSAGPWFSTTAVNGYAHLQTWELGPLPNGTELAVEHRVLNAAGEPVTQDALPTGPATVGGCQDGDVSIG